MMRVLEHNVVARSPNERCADRLVLGEHVVGVVDGATTKPWDDPQGPDGGMLAEAVTVTLAGLAKGHTVGHAVELITDVVAQLLRDAGVPPGAGSAVSFCVVHADRRQVWRVGEARVLVDGVLYPPRTSGEGVVAAARALVLSERLVAGEAIARLAECDPGRGAVQELLRSLVGLRNKADERFGYAAIDGTPVPEQFIEVLPIPPDECEIVLATDGYPELATSLAATERRLADRLHRDPLLIADPPETKGLRPGANSFDDRAYLRIKLDDGSTS